MTSDNIPDPLKPLSEIDKPDIRHIASGFGLEEIHTALSRIVLRPNVPADVRQLFETAKNASLYSWYVYRFHQVSELVAFSAMEMALRIRFEKENPVKKVPALKGLLQHAQREKWIENARFQNRNGAARRNAQHKKFMEVIRSGVMEVGGELVVCEPTEAEIVEALSELDEMGGIVSAANKLRNSLAHGSSMLHPGSISTLSRIAEVINQIY